ncbi:hypothetical protein FA13DRAFT_214505 [Coprinellus micaceus]|uniref:Uncharacterized protein n=1 Tax=Coprinellus micaceus TaxID=71717 RepID=A0A4Y7TGC5_COPMI|nr:hypothetical protein FA13DRAFT_214505 [Coprinellus micaceus]
MECLLESSPGETEHLLGPLRSLLRLYDKEKRSVGLYVTLESTADLITQRCYRILKNRGPEGSARFSPKHNLNVFFTSYCDALSLFIDLSLEVDVDDVQWWASKVQSICSREGRAKVYPRMFASVHRECSMLNCRPACRIWRGEILQRCKSMGWKVPGIFETLRDKYRKYDAQFDDDFPLRPYSQLELDQLVLPPLPNQGSPRSTGCRMPGAWSSELY